jgi:hypothetical protein
MIGSIFDFGLFMLSQFLSVLNLLVFSRKLFLSAEATRMQRRDLREMLQTTSLSLVYFVGILLCAKKNTSRFEVLFFKCS